MKFKDVNDMHELRDDVTDIVRASFAKAVYYPLRTVVYTDRQ